MKGTLIRGDTEWHDGRHDLFDQIMDDCAGEMAECGDGDLNLEGSGTALPGGPGRGIPHLRLGGVLSLLDGLRVDETRGGDYLDGSGTALPGVPEGEIAAPRTPDNKGRTRQWSSPAFGGAGAGDPGGNGGTDPLQEQDPWEGAAKTFKEYSTEAKQLQLRAGAPGGEPEDQGDDDDDDDRGSRRNRGDNPEDLLNKLQVPQKHEQDWWGQTNPSRGTIQRGGGGGGDPSDDGGGDDGHRSIASSRRSQAGDDGYGVRRWHTPKPETRRMEIFKQRKNLPKLIVTGNWRQAQPAMVRQLFENWLAKSVLVMGTWATGAQTWLQARTDRAREEHEHWLSVAPEERAALEKQYMLGETIKVPDADDQLESLLRVELLEVIPDFMSQFATRHAIFDSIAIISMVMRKLLPSH
eukprot:472394-Amphidinium_carterae.2